MPLAAGTRLGQYQILAPIGAGGMGEVYRASDTKLGREVAVKVLPEAFARDPERLARFEREARLLAALNHANIAAIYGFEKADGVPFLVLELVPGPTLAELVAAGPLEVSEALRVCGQIAEALEAAHEKGIAHRDLKPANVKVTPEGKVKVLDFGLAKAFADDAAAADPAQSPTLSVAATRAGTILGTAAYMSPEQARGKPLDKRTDIWAFGCVLYEMLAGRRAFGGDNITDIIAAVVTREPDWSALPAETPANIHALLRRSLEKDPKRRLRNIGDVQWESEELPAVPGQRRRPVLLWAVAALSTALALAVSMLYFRQPPPEQRVIKLSLNPPEKASFGAIAVSPDGLRLAFSATDVSGKTQLWVRALDALAGQPLTGTEGASYAFWSPDSRYIGFFADGKLKKIEAAGGPPQALANAPDNRGSTWSRHGVIVFAPSSGGPLYQVPAAGGEPKPVTQLDASRQENSHRWPQFLPDGRRFLYFNASGQPEQQGIYAGSLDLKEKVRLLGGQVSAAYAGPRTGPGHLLFVRERTLMAQPFDPGKLQTAGESFPVAEQVGVDFFRARFSVSSSGLLVYESIGAGNRQLLWFDRGGKPLGAVGPPGAYVELDLSPDDRRVAANRNDPQTGNADIWLFEPARGASSRFTFHPAIDTGPVWSPDGSRIVFRSSRDGPWNLYQKLASGAGEEELLLKTSGNKRPTGWSRDGRFLLYSELDPNTGWDLWVLPMEGERKPIPVLRTEFDEQWGRFSPDGKWIAYQSNESGKGEIYVRAFSPAQPAGGGRWEVSTGGGELPRWRGDGKELFYLAPDRKLMAVEVKAGTSFETGIPRALFQTRTMVGSFTRYAVTADGRRFLINSEMEEVISAPATVVVNWTAGVKK